MAQIHPATLLVLNTGDSKCWCRGNISCAARVPEQSVRHRVWRLLRSSVISGLPWFNRGLHSRFSMEWEFLCLFRSSHTAQHNHNNFDMELQGWCECIWPCRPPILWQLLGKTAVVDLLFPTVGLFRRRRRVQGCPIGSILHVLIFSSHHLLKVRPQKIIKIGVRAFPRSKKRTGGDVENYRSSLRNSRYVSEIRPFPPTLLKAN